MKKGLAIVWVIVIALSIVTYVEYDMAYTTLFLILWLGALGGIISYLIVSEEESHD